MKNTQRGKIIVIVAPSGSGKSTLIRKLKKDFPTITESTSFTTRKPREGEVDGEHYFFIDTKSFESKIAENDFLEYAKVHSNYYGTSKEFVDKELESGTDLLFDLDVQGVDSFKEYFGKEAKAIFIIPPSIEDLKDRLLKRGTESIEIIEERVRNAKEELERKNDFDFCIVNDELEKAYCELKEVVAKIMGGASE